MIMEQQMSLPSASGALSFYTRLLGHTTGTGWQGVGWVLGGRGWAGYWIAGGEKHMA